MLKFFFNNTYFVYWGLSFFFSISSFISISQNLDHVREICNVLSSKEYAGRGYTSYPGYKETGVEKSRKFILQKIRRIGAYDLSAYVYQSNHFTKPIKFKKTKFSPKVSNPQIKIINNNISYSFFSINGKKMVLGKDYLPDASSPSIGFSGYLTRNDSIYYSDEKKKIILKIENKLIHSVSSVQEDIVFIHLNKDILQYSDNKIRCDLQIKARLEEVNTDNIYAFIPGTMYPDSFIIFSAHYDHLGNIDTTYFPGANDNASGVAVLLDLIQYYKKNPHKYSVAFYFFTGEEIGLVGSKYYTEHPLFDLNRIKFLINLDLMGGGGEGIMVVNGKIFQDAFQILENINQNQNYNLHIKSRGKAQNSDHYWFSENGVKSFFIYTLGDVTAYHDIYDKPEKLKFLNYERFFQLIIQFAQQLR